MKKQTDLYLAEPIESLIVTIRGHKVILDSDLARVYGVSTKVLNQAVKRNPGRFPSDFMFRLTAQEVMDPESQITGEGLQPIDGQSDKSNRSQIVTGSNAGMRSQFVTASEKRNMRFLPYAFTEHGAIMAANVLRSPQAVQMSVFVVRAFVKMREQLISRSEMEKRLLQAENILLSHDDNIRDIYEKIRPLLLPPPDQIGFHMREARARYIVRPKNRQRRIKH